jgi:acetate kinase
MKVLVANIGSTSFKYRVFEMDHEQVLAEGRVERIGQPGSDCPDYDTAIRRCLSTIDFTLDTVGFKAVHAGPLSGAHLVDAHVLAAMEEFSFHAPAHNPPYIAAIRGFQKALPGLPLAVLLETAFFDQVPEAATTYAVPYAWKEELGVRRYGFHGASHRAASENVQRLLGRRDLRHISCHLGGSSSLAAIRNGVAIDSSFGMSAQSGLPHNNRTGDLDPFAVLFVMKRLGLDVDQMATLLATKSGLAGLSGTSGDMRDLEQAAAAGSSRARLAIDVFAHSIRHYIGAFLVELGGLDVLTFSGGIGENATELRAAVCADLSEFGIELDASRNRAMRSEGVISAEGSRVRVMVIPADEERIVARVAASLVTPPKSKSAKVVQSPPCPTES